MAISKKRLGKGSVSRKKRKGSRKRLSSKNSSKGKKNNSKKSSKKQSRGLDGFTNEERLKMDKKIISKYRKLFGNNEYDKRHKVKSDSVLYPLSDARSTIKIKVLLKKNMNTDGSLKRSLEKDIKNCLNKTLYLCK